MKHGPAEIILKLLAVIFSTVPPILATLSYFPVFKAGGAVALISGFSLLLLLISISPLIKLLKRFFSSPTVTGVWFIIFILFFALSKIADEMVVISLVGYLGNLLASFVWRASEGRSREE